MQQNDTEMGIVDQGGDHNSNRVYPEPADNPNKNIYYKEYRSNGTNCALIILVPCFVVSLGLQIYFYTTDPKDKLIQVAGFISIGVAQFLAWTFYFVCYYPVVTQIKVDKNFNKVFIAYRMFCFGRDIIREENISNVYDINILPIRSQYGVVGYVADIYFKDGAKKIQLYKDRGDHVSADFEELSMFILGRNATNNVEREECCDCSAGGCYCVCCDYWGCVLYFFILAGLIYIGISFAIGYVIDNKMFEAKQSSDEMMLPQTMPYPRTMP